MSCCKASACCCKTIIWCWKTIMWCWQNVMCCFQTILLFWQNIISLILLVFQNVLLKKILYLYFPFRFVQYLLYCVSSSLRYVHSSCWGPIVLRSKNQYRGPTEVSLRRITSSVSTFITYPQQRQFVFLIHKIDNFAWILYIKVYFEYI